MPSAIHSRQSEALTSPPVRISFHTSGTIWTSRLQSVESSRSQSPYPALQFFPRPPSWDTGKILYLRAAHLLSPSSTTFLSHATLFRPTKSHESLQKAQSAFDYSHGIWKGVRQDGMAYDGHNSISASAPSSSSYQRNIDDVWSPSSTNDILTHCASYMSGAKRCAKLGSQQKKRYNVDIESCERLVYQRTRQQPRNAMRDQEPEKMLQQARRPITLYAVLYVRHSEAAQ
jgi:hypothetical protein